MGSRGHASVAVRARKARDPNDPASAPPIDPMVAEESQDVVADGLPKRTVALHVGYVGSKFRGTLQGL